MRSESRFATGRRLRRTSTACSQPSPRPHVRLERPGSRVATAASRPAADEGVDASRPRLNAPGWHRGRRTVRRECRRPARRHRLRRFPTSARTRVKEVTRARCGPARDAPWRPVRRAGLRGFGDSRAADPGRDRLGQLSARTEQGDIDGRPQEAPWGIRSVEESRPGSLAPIPFAMSCRATRRELAGGDSCGLESPPWASEST